jgi:hypothetical protein
MLWNSNPDSPCLLTEQEVSNRYAVSLAYLRKHRHLKTGPPYVKVDRLVRYRVSDLEHFFNSHLVLTQGGAE